MESCITYAYYPNVIAVSCLLSQGNVPVQQQWINYATQYIRPAYQYYQDKFNHGPLQPLVTIFKSCRLFDPVKVKEMQPDAAAVNTLPCVPFFDANSVIQPLQGELAAYHRVVTWYMGSGLKAQNMTGIRAQRRGLRAQKNGIRDHKAFEPKSGIRFITRSKNFLTQYFSA